MEPSRPNTVFTIGHSTHPIDVFTGLLKDHAISAVADVRSSPYSSFNPQYNQPDLKAALKVAGIHYVFLGAELGARSDDPTCYVDGKVQFDRLAETDLFRHGIERIATGAEKHRIALMCAEKDPVECHRTILVARQLKAAEISVTHILASGETETHDALEDRMIAMFEMENGDLFLSPEEIKEKAYRLQGDAIAYSMTGRKDDAEAQENSYA